MSSKGTIPEITGNSPNQLILNSNLPTHFVDFAQISTRSDGVAILRFCHTSPELQLFEECRVAGTDAFLKSLVDLLSKQLRYYPSQKK